MTNIPVMKIKQRELTKNITMRVKLIPDPFFKFGLFVIRIGCWIAGIKYKEKTDAIQ